MIQVTSRRHLRESDSKVLIGRNDDHSKSNITKNEFKLWLQIEAKIQDTGEAYMNGAIPLGRCALETELQMKSWHENSCSKETETIRQYHGFCYIISITLAIE